MNNSSLIIIEVVVLNELVDFKQFQVDWRLIVVHYLILFKYLFEWINFEFFMETVDLRVGFRRYCTRSSFFPLRVKYFHFGVVVVVEQKCSFLYKQTLLEF